MSKNPSSPSTGHASNPSAIPAPMQPPRSLPKQNKVWSRFTRRIQAIPLSTKLVTCIIVLLTIGTIGISFSIRTLVGNYLLQKTDTQLINQAQLIFNSMDSLSSDTGDDGRSLMNTYYVEVRDSEYRSTGAGSVPMLRDGVVSEPSLPADGSINGVTLGQPFTTRAVVHITTSRTPDHSIMQAAQSPWRVVALPWNEKTRTGQVKDSGVVFIGLSLSDQIDTANTLTRFCAMVGIAVVLIGAILGTILVQSTLAPLKRIEKTAAKIAAGDLSQRVPDLPESTEVGSLSMSLNTMLTRIEESFHAQEETTEKMKRFVSDASHELRTPLAAIHGYAELYKMQRDMPGALERADESIEHIEASSARMTVLVEDLLSLARLDEGRGIDITQQVKLTSVVCDAADDLHALDPDRGISCGQVVLQPGTDMDHPAQFAFQNGQMPQIELKGDASRTASSGHQHRGQYPPVYAGGLACGDLHGCAPRVDQSRIPIPYAVQRAVASPSGRSHRSGAVHASGYELRDCAIQRPRSRRAAGGTVEDLRTFLHRRPVACASEGRYGTRHGNRAIRGQGASWIHLRIRQRRNGTDPDGGAADRPGRTQAAADYGERESKKRKKESQIKEITLFSVGKADAIGAEGWVRPTSCAKLYLWFENGRMVLPIRVKVSDQQNVR